MKNVELELICDKFCIASRRDDDFKRIFYNFINDDYIDDSIHSHRALRMRMGDFITEAKIFKNELLMAFKEESISRLSDSDTFRMESMVLGTNTSLRDFCSEAQDFFKNLFNMINIVLIPKYFSKSFGGPIKFTVIPLVTKNLNVYLGDSVLNTLHSFEEKILQLNFNDFSNTDETDTDELMENYLELLDKLEDLCNDVIVFIDMVGFDFSGVFKEFIVKIGEIRDNFSGLRFSPVNLESMDPDDVDDPEMVSRYMKGDYF